MPAFTHDVLAATAPARVAAGPSVREWREDLKYLAAQMRLKHKNLFHTMAETDFLRAVAALDAAIPSLDGAQIEVRLMQLVAMVQDGHSGFDTRPFPPSDEPKDRIAIRFARYADGIYVRGAAPELAATVGGKLVQVGDLGWQESMRRVDSLESHDPGNDGELLAWSAKTLLNCPRFLHGLGLSTSSEYADFVIEKNGQRRSLRLRPSASVGAWFFDALPADWRDARPAAVSPPLAMQHADRPYWFTAVPERRALYFQFNLVINDPDESLANFASRLTAALQQPDVERVVIDVRNNTGGDNTLLRPLLGALIRSHLNRRGGMFVLTGPTTFSAAQNFVNRLDNYADVVFVGEPTGENVNFYGDAAGITLPNSHLQAAVSRLWWQDKDPRDQRTAMSPEVAFDPTFADYVAGQDPALEYALASPAPFSLEEELEVHVAGGFDSTLARFQAFAGAPAHKYLGDTETRLNALGYRLLGAGRTADAIAIFRVNTTTHPRSANAFDSLGEAYAAAKDSARALAAYRKSLELNPGNDNARRMIERDERRR